jgi:hypothetical protein
MIKFEGYELVSERLEAMIRQGKANNGAHHDNSLHNYDNMMDSYDNENSKLL